MRKLFAFAFASISVLPVAAQQQSGQTLTAVATYDVRPGKEASFLNLVRKYHGPMFEKLMADGAVVEWGVDRTVFHHRDQPGYDTWFATPNYAGIEKTYGAIQEARSRMTPADLREWDAAVSFERHHDLVLRELASKFKPGGSSELPYLMINSMRVKPGMEAEWMDAGKQYILPIYDKMVDDGTILGYSVMTPAEHTDGPDLRMVLVSLPNLAARDKYEETMNKAFEGQPGMMQKLMSTIQEGSHRDETLKALVWKVKQ